MIFFVWVLLFPFMAIPGLIIGVSIGSYLYKIRYIASIFVSFVMGILISVANSHYDHHSIVDSLLNIQINKIEWHLHFENLVMFQPPLLLTILIGVWIGGLTRRR